MVALVGKVEVGEALWTQKQHTLGSCWALCCEAHLESPSE